MAVKTITITEEAYGIVRSLKSDDESFSELFKRIGRRKTTVGDLAGCLNHSPQEAEDFKRRVLQARKELNQDLLLREKDVRARLQRFNRSD